MQCKICRCKVKDGLVETRNGKICEDCFEKLPDSVKLNIKNFTIRQVFQISKFVHPVSSKAWIESGSFGIGKESIQVKDHEYMLKDLRSVALNFHPRELGRHPNTVIGTITVVLETKMPHFLIEEPFFPGDVTVGYGISGKSVFYHYSYEIEQLFNAIQDCIHDKSYDMTEYIIRYKGLVKKESENKRIHKEAEKRAKEREEKKNSSKPEEEKKETKENGGGRTFQKKAKYSNHRVKELSPFEEAKVLFNVEIPYTAAQIKEARNLLIKKYHPDNMDGSEEMCKRINDAYKLLSKFASN